MSAIGDQVVSTRRGREGLRGEVVWVHPSGDRVVEWLGGEQTSEDPRDLAPAPRAAINGRQR